MRECFETFQPARYDAASVLDGAVGGEDAAAFQAGAASGAEEAPMELG